MSRSYISLGVCLAENIWTYDREEVTGVCGKLLDDELHNLCSSPYVSRVVKSRRMWWARCVVHVGDIRSTHNIGGKSKGKRPIWRPGNGWVLLKLFIKK
jgi:hypothetical protein